MKMTESVPIPEVSTCLLCNKFYERKPVIEEVTTTANNNSPIKEFQEAFNVFSDLVIAKYGNVNEKQLLSVFFPTICPGIKDHPCCDDCFTKLLELQTNSISNGNDEVKENNQTQYEIISDLLKEINVSSKDSGLGVITNLGSMWVPLRELLIKYSRMQEDLISRKLKLINNETATEDNLDIDVEYWFNFDVKRETTDERPPPRKKRKQTTPKESHQITRSTTETAHDANMNPSLVVTATSSTSSIPLTMPSYVNVPDIELEGSTTSKANHESVSTVTPNELIESQSEVNTASGPQISSVNLDLHSYPDNNIMEDNNIPLTPTTTSNFTFSSFKEEEIESSYTINASSDDEIDLEYWFDVVKSEPEEQPLRTNSSLVKRKTKELQTEISNVPSIASRLEFETVLPSPQVLINNKENVNNLDDERINSKATDSPTEITPCFVHLSRVDLGKFPNLKIIQIPSINATPEHRRNEALQAMAKVFESINILQNILQHISNFRHLKRIRLVNRSWRDETLKSWRSIAKVRVYIKTKSNESDSLMKGFNEYNKKCVALEDLISKKGRQFYKLREFPFKNYRILEKVTFPLSAQCSEGEMLFWNTIGPLMKHLHFNAAYFRGKYVLKGMQKLFLEYCPSLEELIMDPIMPIKDWERQNLNIEWDTAVNRKENKNLKTWIFYNFGGYSWSEPQNGFFKVNKDLGPNIFKMLPNLQILKGNPTHELINSISSPTISSGLIRLRALELGKVLDRSDLKSFCTYVEMTSSPLEILKLSISIRNSKIDSCQIAIILRSSQNTMKDLNLSLRQYEEKDGTKKTDNGMPFYFSAFTGLKFSQMTSLNLEIEVLSHKTGNKGITGKFFIALNGSEFPQLSSLKINFDKWEFAKDFVPFDFQSLVNMPNLKSFSYGTSDAMRGVPLTSVLTTEINIMKKPTPLSKLEAFHYPTKFKENCLRFLGEWMPNITDLEIILDKETAPIAFESFPRVKKVTSKVRKKNGVKQMHTFDRQKFATVL